jgi:3-methyladenine DNA glycosylase/8-oxoguanine DNA glycosylase
VGAVGVGAVGVGARDHHGRADPAGHVATGSADGAVTLLWRPPFALDLVRTLSVHRRGPRDPAFRIGRDRAVWRTSLTPQGPATLRVCAGGDGVVAASAWGPGAAWLTGTMPDLLGTRDDPAGFDPDHPRLRQAFRVYHGVKIGRSSRVFEALVPAVLEQKVVGAEAWRAWRYLLLRFGEEPPGPAPAGMRVCPPPQTWQRIPSWEWHRAGAEAVRAKTIIGAARAAGRLEEIPGLTAAEADRRLQALPGIGVWTSAEIRQRACGDPDAVSVGDYHLPGAIGWVLAGRKVDDAGMLELLKPYAGHRHRVARLVELCGLRPQRHGPRMSIRDYRSF